jgi:RimJ/RimL family protein N-acetyltransferase
VTHQEPKYGSTEPNSGSIEPLSNHGSGVRFPPRRTLPGPRLSTERLLLRRWRAEDLGPFAAMNADPVVMEHMPGPLSAAESAALVERIEAAFDANGYGLWAVEVKEEAPFVGFIGLSSVDLDMPFAPAIEVGWRLARDCWGRGIATEAASAAVAFGFRELGLVEIVSFTAAGNLRSRGVMERIGMRRDPRGDFDHPRLAAGDPLRRHVLYRIEGRRSPTATAGAYVPSGRSSPPVPDSPDATPRSTFGRTPDRG